jgi:hypothetical protein
VLAPFGYDGEPESETFASMSKPDKKKKKKSAQPEGASASSHASHPAPSAADVDDMITAHSNELLLIVEAERRQREHLERRLKEAEARLKQTIEKFEKADPTFDLLQLHGQLAMEAEQAAALEALEVTLMQAELQANAVEALSPAPAWPRRRPEPIASPLLGDAPVPAYAPSASVSSDSDLTARLAVEAAEARAAHSGTQVKHLAEELAAARAEQIRLSRELRELKALYAPVDDAAPSQPTARLAPLAVEPITIEVPAPIEPPYLAEPVHQTPAASDEGESLEDALAAFGAESTEAVVVPDTISLEDSLLGWSEPIESIESTTTDTPEASDLLISSLESWGEAQAETSREGGADSAESMLDALESWGGAHSGATASAAPENSDTLLDALEAWGEPVAEPSTATEPEANDALIDALASWGETAESEAPAMEAVTDEEEPLIEALEAWGEATHAEEEALAEHQDAEVEMSSADALYAAILGEDEPAIATEIPDETPASRLEVGMLESLDAGADAASERIEQALSGAPNVLDLAEEEIGAPAESDSRRPTGILARLEEAALSPRAALEQKSTLAEPDDEPLYTEPAYAPAPVEALHAPVDTPGADDFDSEASDWVESDAYRVAEAETADAMTEEYAEEPYRAAEYGAELVADETFYFEESLLPVEDEFGAAADVYGDPLTGEHGEGYEAMPEGMPVDASAEQYGANEITGDPLAGDFGNTYQQAEVIERDAWDAAEAEAAYTEPMPEDDAATLIAEAGEDLAPEAPPEPGEGVGAIAAAVRRAREQRVSAMEAAEAPALRPAPREPEAVEPDRAAKRKSMASALQRFIGK